MILWGIPGKLGVDSMMGLFKKQTLKVKPETPLIHVIIVLYNVGVIIKGRYTIKFTSEGTFISYLVTDLQQMMIDEILPEYLEYCKERDSQLKN